MKIPEPRRGLSLAELVLALGLAGLAFMALLSVCSLGLRSNEQNMVYIKAVQVADTEMNRAIVGILYDLPAGTKAAFWGNNFTFPTTAFRKGTSVIGGDEIHWAIYATAIGALGTTPANNVSKLDTYVWWKEQGPGSKLTSCTRLINYGEDP